MNINNENKDLVDKIVDESIPIPVQVPTNPDEYIKLNKDCAKYLGISTKTWGKYKHSGDFTVVETEQGWEKKGLTRYKLLRKSKDNRKQGVMQGEARTRKLEIDIKIKEAQLKALTGKVIDWDKHLGEMAELLEKVIINYDYFVNEVGLIKDNKVLKIAEQLRDKSILQLKQQIEHSGKKELTSSSSSEESSSETQTRMQKLQE